MEPLVSIIIPVYNLEKYVLHCLHSVQAQTYTNWEALCVDDGSKDGSLAVLQTAAKQDARIRILHQENAGASTARNRGMQQAKGEYLCFLDGDDVLHPQALEQMLYSMRSGAYDLIVAEIQRITSYEVMWPTLPISKCAAIDYVGLFQLESMAFKSACAKLFRSDVALRVRFSESFACSEDTHYLFQILAANDVRIGYVNRPLYGYYARPDSVTMRTHAERNLSAQYALRDICAMLENSSNDLLFGMAMKMLIQEAVSYRMFLSDSRECVQICRQSCRMVRRQWLHCRAIPLRTRLLYYSFDRLPCLYKTVRILIDPTLLDYFKQRKRKKENAA